MNMNLYIVSVDLINGLYPIVLDVLSLIAIFVGILVITTKNPVKRFGKPLLLWDKLSNSGNSLKLLLPNCIRKATSGWSNYSCMVISQKIIEKEKANRGSKSDYILTPVKEQRVDGSWYIKSMYLRYTLKGFERNYRVRIPSNQIIKATLSTLIPTQSQIQFSITHPAGRVGRWRRGNDILDLLSVLPTQKAHSLSQYLKIRNTD